MKRGGAEDLSVGQKKAAAKFAAAG